jgi:hypothetical protein
MHESLVPDHAFYAMRVKGMGMKGLAGKGRS